MTDQPAVDPVQAFAALGQINLADSDMADVLNRVAALARLTIPNAAEVSVTLLQDGKPSTAAFTGKLALYLDERQYEAGYGPCLDACRAGKTLVISDMTTEDRWPDYTPKAVRRGAGSSISIGLPILDAVSGALNIYGAEPETFDEDAIELARTFASYAAVALTNAQLYTTTAALARQMQEAMASRAVIEQAKGVITAQHGCSTEEAFGILVRASQAANRKLRDIAEELVKNVQSTR